MSQTDAYIDVVELCGLFQCLGFRVKKIDVSDVNSSTDGVRTIVVDCQASGLHVVLESGNFCCSCPPVTNQHNSGIWQVSGVTGGRQFQKEFGSTILGSLSKVHREHLTKELLNIVRCIKEYNESDSEKFNTNRSNSMLEMTTPEKIEVQVKADTPTRYRSLDTLTAAKAEAAFPPPGSLLKQMPEDNVGNNKTTMVSRQSTYTLSSTPEISRTRSKTSSPIRKSSNSVLESLMAAERKAEELRCDLSHMIKELTEDAKYDSSSSLALDVSKISVLKAQDNSKAQFASSPNLSGLGYQDKSSKKLKGTESASTSNLAQKSKSRDVKTSKLLKISNPNLFKFSSNLMSKSAKDNDKKSSKIQSLIKSKIVTEKTKTNTESSPNISGTRKRFGNIKSTIPRPASRKE